MPFARVRDAGVREHSGERATEMAIFRAQLSGFA